jgi:hypothetical protein
MEHARAYAARNGCGVEEAHVDRNDGISGAGFAAAGIRLADAALKPKQGFQGAHHVERVPAAREAIETAYAMNGGRAGVLPASRTVSAPLDRPRAGRYRIPTRPGSAVWG